MEEQLTPHRIANSIMMDKRFEGYYLLVEGIKDTKLYSKYIDLKKNRVKGTFGKFKMLEIFKILNENSFHKKIGVIDSDFNQILGIEHTLNGLFVTDYHDIEVMMIKTQALDNILRIFLTEEGEKKIKLYEENERKSLREKLLEFASEIGYLKLANIKHELGLVFKPTSAEGNQLPYNDFIDTNNFTFKGKESLIQTCINYSRNKSPNLKGKDEITKKYEELRSQIFDIDHLVNGHDLTNLLYIALKKTFKSNNKSLVNYKVIEDSLILAYDFNDFSKTKLFQTLKNYLLSNEILLFKEEYVS